MNDFSDEDFEWLHKAIMFARDSAFLNIGDKDHPTVKRWESLRDKLGEARTKAYFERRVEP